MGNEVCINNCKGNLFKDNEYCDYGQGDGIIPGYNLFFLISIPSLVAIFLIKKIRKS